MVLKEYVWVKDGKPVEVKSTCCGDPIEHNNRCINCLGEEFTSEECINTLLHEGYIKEVNTSMNLIEALQKWNKVTNDGGKTVYSTTSGGHVVTCTDELGGVINPTIKLLTSKGWEQYLEPLKLPERVDGEVYYHIGEYQEIDIYLEEDTWIDRELYEKYNYFTDKAFAQYVADKQFIQRAKLTLEHLNKSNPDKEILISEYIRDNHKEVIDRIKEYEENNL